MSPHHRWLSRTPTFHCADRFSATYRKNAGFLHTSLVASASDVLWIRPLGLAAVDLPPMAAWPPPRGCAPAPPDSPAFAHSQTPWPAGFHPFGPLFSCASPQPAINRFTITPSSCRASSMAAPPLRVDPWIPLAKPQPPQPPLYRAEDANPEPQQSGARPPAIARAFRGSAPGH